MHFSRCERHVPLTALCLFYRDTVASVGIIPRELPFVSSNTAITYFRHALALDEHRGKFIPNFYQASKSEQKLAESEENASETRPSASPLTRATSNGKSPSENGKKKGSKHMTESQLHQQAVNAKLGTVTDSKEVWFAGCHCDVGGGSVPNDTRHSLARIPLRWMIRECFACKTGIIFDAEILQNEIGINPNSLYPDVKKRDPTKRIVPNRIHQIGRHESQGFMLWDFVKFVGSVVAIPLTFLFKVVSFPIHHTWLLLKYSRAGHWIREKLGFKGRKGKKNENGELRSVDGHVLPDEHNHDGGRAARTPFVSEELEDLNDALSPEYDQLSLRWIWWIIEFLPLRFRSQEGSRDDFYVK